MEQHKKVSLSSSYRNIKFEEVDGKLVAYTVKPFTTSPQHKSNKEKE